MRNKFWTLILIGMVISLALGKSTPVTSAPQAASTYTGFYELSGFEGIPAIGANGHANGPAPAVGDYATTYCRYINAPTTDGGQYYLHYPLHLPNGSKITKIEAFVADFQTGDFGYLTVSLRIRPWNSINMPIDYGSNSSAAFYGNGTVTINFELTPISVDNRVNTYSISVTPQVTNNPGALCVYNIRVTYTYDGAFIPFISR